MLELSRSLGPTGRVIRVPPDARFPDGLQFALAKVAWDGHIVFLPGLGGNPPRATAYALLWPQSTTRDSSQ